MVTPLKVLRAAAAFPGRIRREGAGRTFNRYLEPLVGVPNMMRLGRAIRIGLRPIAFTRRRILPRDHSGLTLIHDYLRIPDDFLEGTSEIVAHCASIFERDRADLERRFEPPYIGALGFVRMDNGVAIERPADVAPIVRFCAQPKLFNLVANYLGERPVIASIALGYTRPNNALVGSQRFHRDVQAKRQVHLVMPIWEIDEECGPFTFLPSDKSAAAIKGLKHVDGRVADEALLAYADENDFVTVTGSPGAAYLVNAYRCFHMGARARSKPRLILIVSFRTLFVGASSDECISVCLNRRALYDGSPEMRMLLDL